MFVYQDKDGNICVTFKDNKPVETPEYVIAIDEDAKALYTIAGTIGALAETTGETVEEGEESSESGEEEEDPEE